MKTDSRNIYTKAVKELNFDFDSKGFVDDFFIAYFETFGKKKLGPFRFSKSLKSKFSTIFK